MKPEINPNAIVKQVRSITKNTQQKILLDKEISKLFLTASFGGIGGFGKAFYETIFAVEQVPTINTTPLPYRFCGYGFLGAVSSVLVLSSIIKYMPTHNIFKIAITCGLLFPTIISSTVKVSNLENQLRTVKEDKIQVETSAISQIEELATLTNNPQAQITAVESLQRVVQTSQDNEKVQLVAVESLQEVAQTSQDNEEVQISVIESLQEVAENSESESLQDNVVESLTKVSRSSNNKQVQISGIRSLEKVAETSSNSKVQANIVQSLVRVAVNSQNLEVSQSSVRSLVTLAENSNLETQMVILNALRSLMKTEDRNSLIIPFLEEAISEVEILLD